MANAGNAPAQKKNTTNTASAKPQVNQSRCWPSRAGVKNWKMASPAAAAAPPRAGCLGDCWVLSDSAAAALRLGVLQAYAKDARLSGYLHAVLWATCWVRDTQDLCRKRK